MLVLVIGALWAASPAIVFAQALEPESPVPQAPPSDAPVQPAKPEEAAGERIVEIRVEGNKRVETAAIERGLVQKKGDVFNPALTSRDLQSLWKLGYFSDVQLLVQRLPQGGVAYVIRVEERPSVREVKLEGNQELSKDDFKEQLDIRANSILDLGKVRDNAKKIQEKYIEKGYFLAEVTWRLDKVPETNQVDVVFVIREHSKVQVKEITFIGAERVPASVLKEAMATKEANFLSFLTNEGNYREELFQRDLAMIQAAYYDRGFINVKVEKPIVTISADKKDIYIAIRVEEGEQYQIGKLDFSGDLIVPKARLAALMSSHTGELFNRTQLSRDILAITDVYLDAGYAYANVNPLTAVHAENKTIDLTFDVQKGRQVTIERIDVSGNTKTRDKVIRRELRVYEGDLFSGTGMRASQERVNALGFFETVEVTQKPGTADDKIVIVVDVKEKPTGTFQVGLGFSNVENFVFTAQVSQNNFLGWGQSVSLSLQLSGLRNFIQASYFDPYFLDTDFILSSDLYRVQADYLGFIRNSTGGNVNFGRHLPWDPDMMLSLTYTLEFVEIEQGTREQETPLAGRFRNGSTSSLRASFTWDKRDNRLFPSKGFMLFGSVEVAPQFLGGSFLFTRYTAYGRRYWQLPFGAVFKINGTVGYVAQLDPNLPLPVSELYFVGGINSVRGYYLRSITPTTRVGNLNRPDVTTNDQFPIGGDKQFVLNAELEFPIFEKVGVRGVLFYDNGNAWGVNERFFEDKQDDLPLGLFHSVGFGFRWFSPIGPLRFEWGIPLNPRSRSPAGGRDQPILFEFTIGNFF